MNSSIQAEILHQAAIERHNQKKAIWDRENAQARIEIERQRQEIDRYWHDTWVPVSVEDPAPLAKPLPRPAKLPSIPCPECGGKTQDLGGGGAFCLDCEWDNLKA